jgi:hypothetical protein
MATTLATRLVLDALNMALMTRRPTPAPSSFTEAPASAERRACGRRAFPWPSTRHGLRERLFTPRLRVTSYDELNAWLLDQCVAYAKANRHPELTDQTIWQVFEAERAKLVPISGRFDGFRATQASVGRPVEIQDSAERIVIRQDGAIVGEHARCFGRNQTIYDPWHYVPVLARKPGALRNGAPFKDWVLPASLEHVRRQRRARMTAIARWSKSYRRC